MTESAQRRQAAMTPDDLAALDGVGRPEPKSAGPKTANYVLLEDDPRFGLSAGDVLACHPYRYEYDKLTVVRRVSDGFDPECNVYRSQVKKASQ